MDFSWHFVVEIVIPKVDTKTKVIIAISTSSTTILVLLITTIYVWRLMGRIKALHIILEGEIALAFLESIFLTKASSINKILEAKIECLEGYDYKSR